MKAAVGQLAAAAAALTVLLFAARSLVRGLCVHTHTPIARANHAGVRTRNCVSFAKQVH